MNRRDLILGAIALSATASFPKLAANASNVIWYPGTYMHPQADLIKSFLEKTFEEGKLFFTADDYYCMDYKLTLANPTFIVSSSPYFNTRTGWENNNEGLKLRVIDAGFDYTTHIARNDYVNFCALKNFYVPYEHLKEFKDRIAFTGDRILKILTSMNRSVEYIKKEQDA